MTNWPREREKSSGIAHLSARARIRILIARQGARAQNCAQIARLGAGREIAPEMAPLGAQARIRTLIARLGARARNCTQIARLGAG